MNDLHQQEHVPAMKMNQFFDAILRNPVNLEKQAARTILLNENAWLLLDVAGMPLWGLA